MYVDNRLLPGKELNFKHIVFEQSPCGRVGVHRADGAHASGGVEHPGVLGLERAEARQKRLGKKKPHECFISVGKIRCVAWVGNSINVCAHVSGLLGVLKEVVLLDGLEHRLEKNELAWKKTTFQTCIEGQELFGKSVGAPCTHSGPRPRC